MRLNSFFSKLVIILLVLLLTFLYAQYEKKKYYFSNSHIQSELFLKKLPDFNSLEIPSNRIVNSYEFLKESSGLFIHIWGTWCAPCEKEMPEFIKYAQSVEGRGIHFVLVAVNDDVIKVKKFMARYALPKNIKLVLDNENKVMDLFGTLKVPETFLFNATGKHVNKFIGPQEWGEESYQTRLVFWLNTQNYVDRKIETH